MTFTNKRSNNSGNSFQAYYTKPAITNQALETAYLQERMNAAAAKREAAKAEKETKEKLLRDIANDSRQGLNQKKLREKYNITRYKLTNYLEDILIHRY